MHIPLLKVYMHTYITHVYALIGKDTVKKLYGNHFSTFKNPANLSYFVLPVKGLSLFHKRWYYNEVVTLIMYAFRLSYCICLAWNPSSCRVYSSLTIGCSWGERNEADTRIVIYCRRNGLFCKCEDSVINMVYIKHTVGCNIILGK